MRPNEVRVVAKTRQANKVLAVKLKAMGDDMNTSLRYRSFVRRHPKAIGTQAERSAIHSR